MALIGLRQNRRQPYKAAGCARRDSAARLVPEQAKQKEKVKEDEEEDEQDLGNSTRIDTKGRNLDPRCFHF